MTNVIYKNLDKSEAFTKSVNDKLDTLKYKFPELQKNSIRVTINMDNSPVKPGQQLFSVKFCINNGRYKGLTLRKSATCLYTALSIASEKLKNQIAKVKRKRRSKKREKLSLKMISENLQDVTTPS